MMKHIVMFKRLADVEPQSEREAELVAQMHALEREIDFIHE